MKCANCAKDNPAGARYCIHCGAEQALPTPIAAVAAAAMASGRRAPVRQAANAAQAEPIADHAVAQESEPAPWQRLATSEPAAARGAAAADDAQPAYAALPRRTGLAVALIAACVVVAAVAFTVVRVVQPNAPSMSDETRDASDSVMSSFPPDATPPGTRRTPTDVATSRAAADAGTPNTASPATTAAVPPAETATEAPPVEIRPLPARPAPRTTRRVAPEKGTEAPAASLAPAPVAPAVVAAAPKATAARAPDSWARMRDELSRCTREDFITRVICDQRVRFRYCKDYWGKVAECPGNPPADHGQ